MKKLYKQWKLGKLLLKFDLKMKLTTLLLITTVFGLSANDNSYAQKTKITLEVENASVRDIIDDIESTTEFRFIYKIKHVDLQRKLSIQIREGHIETVLKSMFGETNTVYKVRGTHIILRQGHTKSTLKKVPEQTAIDQSPDRILVTGKVTDNRGTPLPGANILEKGTTNGTLADVDGNFSLEVAGENAVLLISFIGYANKEVAVNGQNNFTIILEESVASLGEVVVVGYGTQEKKDITGSIVSISAAENFKKAPAVNTEQLIQGRAAGVQVQQVGGDLTGDFEINIRGLNSTNNNSILYVVDGVPLNTVSFSSINPADIASIDILKDASAAAIYGARASNGVVVITTKKGKPGKTAVNLEARWGIENDLERLDMMNTAELLEFSENAYINNGQAWPGISPELAAIDNDWQDLVLQQGNQQEYILSVSGGNEDTRFYVSGNYLDRKGIMVDSWFKRASFRINIDHNVNSKINLGARLSTTAQWNEGAGGDSNFDALGYRQSLFSRPWNPFKDENGNFTGIPSRSAPNNGPQENGVARLIEDDNENKENRFLGNFFVEYELLEGLKFRSNLGIDLINRNNYSFNPIYDRLGYRRTTASASNSNSLRTNIVADQTLTYNKEFGNHKITGLVGYSIQKFNTESSSITRSGGTSNILDQVGNQPDLTAGGGSETQSGLQSYFLRVNYDYGDKYLFTGTVRRDATSNFPPANKWGTFPSASVAWRISEEDFMQDLSFLEDLKIRASYGLTGNQNIGSFQFLTQATGRNYVFGDDLAGGIAPGTFPNENIKWESQKQLDVGIDAVLFNGRLSVVLDYYREESEDLLAVVPAPPSAGISSNPTVNVGSIRNTGFELGLISDNIVGEFSWKTSFNIASNKNEVIEIGLEDADGNPARIPGEAVAGFLGGIPINLTTSGQPIGAFYTHIFQGIWQTGEAAEAATFGREPGDSKYADLDGDGTITVDDRAFVGQWQPKLYGGMDNTLAYKNFTLSIFINWQSGNKVFNQVNQFIASGHPAINGIDLPYWTAENPGQLYPRPINSGVAFGENSRPSTRLLEDASFLRIKNVSLAYDLPGSLLERVGLSSARIAISGTNLATFTEYSGLDPESASNGFGVSGGFDQTPFPLSRIYMVTLNIGI